MTQQPDTSTHQPPTPTPRVSRRFKLVALATLTVVTLLVAEFALRVAGIHDGGIILQSDPWTGVRHIPNRTLVQDAEGFGIVEINNLGLRDHDTTIEKPADTYRIALVGDSYIEAAQVALENAVSEKLEAHLNRSTSKTQVEVLNFGVSGFSTAQEYLNIKHHILPFKPDLILLSMTVTNDIRDNHPDLSRTPRPVYHLTNDEELELDTSFRQPTHALLHVRTHWPRLWRSVSWIASNSRLAGLAIEAARNISQHKRHRPQPTAPGDIPPDILSDLTVYKPDAPAPWDDAWTITEKLLLKTRDLCRNHDFDLLVIIQATARQIDPNTRSEFATHHPEFDLDYPERRITAFCASHDIQSLALSPTFRKHRQSTGQHLHGFGQTLGQGHWNDAGHALAAKIIHVYLNTSEILPDTLRTAPD